ncbi:hypothetical protein JAAARDRAFT_29227 [Jaapia argillacea MUCL 33604]|uniref:Uncharacterized protein n=1 Tax=Jaapia argillacea MUCL 33604 TaxID=933084 RepID=A0A067QI59_9AGAM|nr:hypothetical protein JAAARDRAFT_29227 [Jaapia argillacea MUCL 33604]
MMMRPLQPTYPSFTLVITQAQLPADLSASRNSRRKRRALHPTSSPAQFEDPLMVTVDYRDQASRPFPTVSSDEVISNEATGAVCSLDAALQAHPGNGSVPNQLRSKRLSLSSLVVDLALAVRRRSHNVFSAGTASPSS